MKFTYKFITSYDPRLGVVTQYPTLEAVVATLFKDNPPQNAKQDLLQSIRNKSKLWGLYFRGEEERYE